ncbi:(2Fe-2S)-binding protein [Pararhodonellum marinum]|uniref:(2Fe-2S)-binding protein n=1 Tax=Pararhodonellum marinum TaxID=2755358 RepID=UPI00188E3F9C|nr:(2Fe-2S)-binding protein [Pararhodonellum marinum]
MPEIILEINGKEEKLDVDPKTPLLYALRGNLSLNAPKFGCGLGQCGTCMVLVNGSPQPSCLLTCESMSGKSIRTLEDLGNEEKMDPVQEAFFEKQAAQCGFCTNGMIICAKALLEQHSEPTTADITNALNRVLCRCGSHSRILDAVKYAVNLKRNQG